MIAHQEYSKQKEKHVKSPGAKGDRLGHDLREETVGTQKAIAGLLPHGTLFHWAIRATVLRADEKGLMMVKGDQ